MKVALAHDHLFQIGGAERVLKELKIVFKDAPIYTLIHDQRFELFKDYQIITSYLQKFPGSKGRFKYFLPLMPSAWEAFDFSNYDLVISSSSAFVKGLITQPQTKHVCYCHSPTRYLWSDNASYVANLHVPGPVKAYLRVLLSKLRVWDQLASQRVDHYIANSKFVQERIKKYYNRESTIIYPPVQTDDFSIDPNPDNFYLIVSRLRPYKKVDLAIKAFNALRLPLVIIGGGEEYHYLKKMAKPNIKFLGEVNDSVRNSYLRRAKALIHPQEEDFGITAVEAMASGRPVIAYGKGGALETIIPNQTGVLFADQTWEALADAVIHFDVSQFNPEIIREHSLQYDTQKFREKMDNYIKEVV